MNQIKISLLSMLLAVGLGTSLFACGTEEAGEYGQSSSMAVADQAVELYHVRAESNY